MAAKAMRLGRTPKGMHDEEIDRPVKVGEGTCATQRRAEAPTILPPTPECISIEGETRDELALKKAEASKPLDLVLLDPNLPEAIAIIGIRMTVGMRDTLQQLLVEYPTSLHGATEICRE